MHPASLSAFTRPPLNLVDGPRQLTSGTSELSGANNRHKKAPSVLSARAADGGGCSRVHAFSLSVQRHAIRVAVIQRYRSGPIQL
jgi:hypothetical protein